MLCFLLLAVSFLIVNRAAYKSYFQDDEFDTLGWAQVGSVTPYLKAAVSPQFSVANFRPTAAFYFRECLLSFGLDFPKFVAILQAIHLLNVWLIWLLARRLGAKTSAAALACIFFAFHMALFDAFWKPMYIYDVLCATFCLLSILFYARRWWVLSFVCYWLAYKSKELAVMLPLVLACYEIWFGKRRWKPLVPFFLASLSFGVQGLLFNPNKDNEYTFRFTPQAFQTSSIFYAGRVLLVPYLGFLVPLAALLSRNRRTWFGLALMGAMFFPLLFLPGRLFSPYCYAPFTGLAIVLAGIVETTGALPVALLILLWLPVDLQELRAQRSVTLARAVQVHAWVDAARGFVRTRPQFDAIAWAGGIPGFARWGITGALSVLFQRADLQVFWIDGGEPPAILKTGRVAYLVWNISTKRLSTTVHATRAADCSYIDAAAAPGTWQLDSGWNDVDGGHRWTAPTAEARLLRPAGATRFVVHWMVPWDQITRTGGETLHVTMDGRELEPRRFDHGGEAQGEWTLSDAPPGPVRVSFAVDPVYQPAAAGLGIAVRSFGFAPAR